MADTVATAVLPGVALGSVVAVAAAWARLAGKGAVPHLAVGATAGVAVALAGRLTPTSWAVSLAVAVLAGTVLGEGGRRLDARITQLRLPGLPAPPPQLADVVLLAAAAGLAEAARAPLALPIPLGPLGGQPGTVHAVAAVLVGLGGAAFLSVTGTAGGWRLAGAATAASAVLASGVLAPAPAGLVLPAAADPAGLAVRAVAAALVGGSAPAAAAAAVLLGLAETLAALVDPVRRWGSALWIAAGLIGLVRLRLAVAARARQAVRR